MAINPNLKALWRVSSPYTAPVTLRATDWISALGAALHQLGRAKRIDRMACERLPNGDLIINDLTNDSRYIVQQLAAAEDLPELGAVDDITETGRQIAAAAAMPTAAVAAVRTDDDEILAMGDAAERIDPYGGWGMSLEIDPDDDLFSEDQPIIETYNPGHLSREDTATGEEPFAFEEETGPIAVGAAPLDTDEIPLEMGDAPLETDEDFIEAGEAPIEAQFAPIDTEDAPLDTEDAPIEAMANEKPYAAPEFEDIFTFEEEDLSVLPDDITLIETSPRRGLSEALKEIRARRNSGTSSQ